MAAVQGSQPKSVSKGCFKCGKSGHWSRDCNAPPSEWIARAPAQQDQGNSQTQAQIPEAAEYVQLGPGVVPDDILCSAGY